MVHQIPHEQQRSLLKPNVSRPWPFVLACCLTRGFANCAKRNLSQRSRMILKTFLLFVVTAIAEIVGCYLPYLWLRKGGSPWLLVPAALSLAVFAWLLTMHPAASGRVYAAYGCVYVITALSWLKFVDGVSLSTTDMVGGLIALAGMLIIVSGWGSAA